jgi:hypothetical protein
MSYVGKVGELILPRTSCLSCGYMDPTISDLRTELFVLVHSGVYFSFLSLSVLKMHA